MFENIKADFTRFYNKDTRAGKGKIRKIAIIFFFLPGFQAVLNYRICHWLVNKRVSLFIIVFRRITEILTGISISPNVNIGKGLLLYHFGGIVIGCNAIIGEYCTISHGVTIGNKVPSGILPTIGNNVYISVGAKVLGVLTIGDNCIIGANAVVLDSFTANSVIAGIPAKKINVVSKINHSRFIEDMQYIR